MTDTGVEISFQCLRLPMFSYSYEGGKKVCIIFHCSLLDPGLRGNGNKDDREINA